MSDDDQIRIRRTERGFAKGEFTDRYGVTCSIQKSSLATEDAIWLGVDDPNPRVCVLGEGWKPIDLDALAGTDVLVTTRMHFTQEMVARLIPLLEHFVETGELPGANE